MRLRIQASHRQKTSLENKEFWLYGSFCFGGDFIDVMAVSTAPPFMTPSRGHPCGEAKSLLDADWVISKNYVQPLANSRHTQHSVSPTRPP